MTFLTLDKKGLVAAAFLGVALLALAGFRPLLVSYMLYFLLLSAAVTVVGKRKKKAMKVYQKSRGLENVLSNGLGPLIFAVMFFISTAYTNTALAGISLIGFGASVAAVTSDKFSSELGVLDGEPRDIFTMKTIKRGASGGITAFGLAAGLFATLLISIPFSFMTFKVGAAFPYFHSVAFVALIACTVGGFSGTLIDSVLGHFEERGLGNKFTSNFACSVVGGIIGFMILALVI